MVPLIAEKEIALPLLVERLRWPVPMVRWKTAKALRSLLVGTTTREAATQALLAWLSARHFESEALAALSVFAVSPLHTRPPLPSLETSIIAPSIGSDFLLNEMYGVVSDNWRSRHSGTAPSNFTPDSYFDEYKTAQVPGHLLHELEFLESKTKLPFRKQWAFEWTNLRERHQVRYTRYPTYFGDYGLQRDGMVGQFIQQQAEVYRSAYQRALACAASEWQLPLSVVGPFSICGLPALPGLFDVDPVPRPSWLPKIDASILYDRDLTSVAMDLLSREPKDDFRTVLLRIPLDKTFDEFGELEIAAHFISDDFEPLGEPNPNTSSQFTESDQYHFDMVRQHTDPRPIPGKTGGTFPICCDEMPMVHGYWHGAYYQRGVSLPAPYCFQKSTYRRANADGIRLMIGTEQVASTIFWHDAWTPLYPPNGATRIGTSTRMQGSLLAAAENRLSRKLGWHIRVSRMEKSEGGFEVKQTVRTAFTR
ncbi:hypothetical protein [Pseudorhizobium marinum]|uniref:hypothetical protein n=1 Tax=Pseudorhizobium marinum TaxID=1496690 RepID=UPI000AA9B78E|nr:hypothetical protein [Pseudorhizobium marinum]